MGNMKRILCSERLPFDPAQEKKKCVERTCKVRKFLDNFGDEVAKNGRRQSKRRKCKNNTIAGLLYCKHIWLSFPALLLSKSLSC